MSLPKNKYAALEELLRSMFDETELRAFIHRLPEADRLVASLPGATASLLKVVFDAINLLNRHGVIDADFFEALARERPRMCGDIAEVALVWEVTLPDSVTASQSGASAASQPKDKSQPNAQICEALVAEPAEEIPTTNKPSPPTSPERWDVFVSYAHEDQEWVRLLVENLHELGLEVFYDEWEIDYGDTVSLRLSDGLRRSRSGVLVVSPTAVSRPWVLEEYASLLECAVQRRQRLIPVLYLDAEMPAMLSTRRWIDLRGKTGNAYLAEVARLAAALKGERPTRPKRGQGLRAPGSSIVVPTSSVDPTPTPVPTTSPAPTITSAEVVKAAQGRRVEMSPRRGDPALASYRWLHLSDLHIGCRGEAEWIQMVDDFERSLDEWLPRVGAPDLVLLTGDLTNRGLREEFARLDVFLERLLTWIERHSGGARPLVIPVPGNHDLQRPSEDDLLDNYAAYERYIVTDDRMGQRLHKRLWEAEKGTESAERVGQLFAEYIGWLERAIVPRLTSRASEVKLHTSFFPGDLSAVVELPGRGFPLAVVGLNSSWLQLQGGDHERKLAMPLAQFHAALLGDSPLDLFHKDRVHRSLLMMHHPPTWLAERFEREFLRGIYRPDRFAICLHGHMHEPTSKRIAVAGGEDRLFFQAPSLSGLEHYGTSKESRLFGYSFGELREDGEVRAWPLDRAVKGDGVSEFVPDHHRWRWLDTPVGESVEYRQHVRLRRGDGRLWRSQTRDGGSGGAKRTGEECEERPAMTHRPPVEVIPPTSPRSAELLSEERPVFNAEIDVLDRRADEVRIASEAAGELRLRAEIDAHLADSRRLARHPRLDAMVQSLVGAPMLDIEQVFVVPRVRPDISPAEVMRRRVQGRAEEVPLGVARPILEVWPRGSPWLLVLGDPGAGKSTLARWLMFRPDCGDSDVPVRIELQQYEKWRTQATRSSRGFFEYLEALHADERAPLGGDDLLQLAEAGKVLWLLDGLDEIPDPDDRLNCARRIANLRRHGGRAVITTRPLGLGREIALLQEAGIATCTLEPFDEGQLCALASKWKSAGLIDEQGLRRFHDRLAASAALRELARSPLIAAFVLVLAREGDLPTRRCHILAAVSALVVQRWAEQRSCGAYVLDVGERMAFLRALAWEMQSGSHGLGNVIERGRLRRFTICYLIETRRIDRDQAEVLARSVIDELGTRIHALAWLGGTAYGFSHRSFLEYFAADSLARLDAKLVMAQISQTWRQGEWSEVLAMTIGLRSEDQPDFLVWALGGVFASLECFDGEQLLAASEFAVRCLCEVDDLDYPLLQDFCEKITALWIELGAIARLDFRGLAKTLRRIGPRWPGQGALLDWIRRTDGLGPVSGVSEFHTGFSRSGETQQPTLHLALAVLAAEQRGDVLAHLADCKLFLFRYASELAEIGPWTEAEKRTLETTLFSAGEDWDLQVLVWLGDIAGTEVERSLVAPLQDRLDDSYDVIRRALLLLGVSRGWSLALERLDEVVMAEEAHDLPGRLAEVFAEVEPDRRESIARKMMRAQAPELRAAAYMFLAEGGDDDAAARLVEMLRDPDMRTAEASNRALAHGRYQEAHRRVMDHLGDDVEAVTLTWAVSAFAHTADQLGPEERAFRWWTYLADGGLWSPSMRWMAIGAMLRRERMREHGMERLRSQQLATLGNRPNIDYVLGILAANPDGPATLDKLLREETDPIRRRWIAEALLLCEPGASRARVELCDQAARSTQRDDQYQLARAMRRLGLPLDDWEYVARKIVTHVEDPIARCAAAQLLGDRVALEELAASGSVFRGMQEHAQRLLRCEELRLEIAGVANQVSPSAASTGP